MNPFRKWFGWGGAKAGQSRIGEASGSASCEAKNRSRKPVSPDRFDALRDRAVELVFELLRDKNYDGTTAQLDMMDDEARCATVTLMLWMGATLSGCDRPTVEYLFRENADPNYVRAARIPLGDDLRVAVDKADPSSVL
jgi:hypothetical protein